MRCRAACFLLLSCVPALAREPKYQKPEINVPQNWQAPSPWKEAAPKDGLAKGTWWTIFGDPELNQYEERSLANNQSLKAAAARLAEARSFARIAASSLYPQVGVNPSAQRERVSGNRPTPGAPLVTPVTLNIFQIPFELNYEVDLFGRVRHSLEAANATYQATAADLENVRLTITAEVAADYFQLRELDAEIEVVRKAIDYQQKGLQVVVNRHSGGATSGLDVAQQQTVLNASQAQLALLQQQRDQFQHALAALQGLPASTFIAPVRALDAEPPAIPTLLPSELLERRPDVAEAERSAAAANARIGVARAALYPSISIGGSGGYQSTALSSLLNVSSTFWSLGISALQPILNGGRNRAAIENARAVYEETAANYRESALIAFQQVEDALSSLNALSSASASQQQAVDAANRALTIATARYSGGLVTYLDVITAQEQVLNNERLAAQIRGQRLVSSVLLVKALGGGWDSASLAAVGFTPRPKQVLQP